MSFFASIVTVFNRIGSLAMNEGKKDGVERDAAEAVAERARQNIIEQGLVDSGFMLDTTGARKAGDGYSVGTDAHYGEFVEFGTWKMSARPWLIPAIESASGEFERAIGVHFG